MVTREILNGLHNTSVKRVKTEKQEVSVQNDMFGNIYQNMKKKMPALSVHSYFIAWLHSTKETDMEMVNSDDVGKATELACPMGSSNSETNIKFAFY